MNDTSSLSSLWRRMWGKSLFAGLFRSHLSLVGLGVASFLFALVALFGLEERMNHALNHSEPVLEGTLAAIEGVYAASGAVKGMVALKGGGYRREWEMAWGAVIDPAIERLETGRANDPLTTDEEWKELTGSLRDLHEAQWWIFDAVNRHGEEPATHLMAQWIRPVSSEIEEAITTAIESLVQIKVGTAPSRQLKLLADYRYHFATSVSHLGAFISSGLSPAEIDLRRKENMARKSLQLIAKEDFDKEIRPSLALIQRLYPRYLAIADRLVTMRKGKRWSVARAQMAHEVEPLERKVLDALSQYRRKAVAQVNLSTAEAMGAANGVVTLSAGFIALLVVAGYLLSSRYAKRIAAPVTALMEATRLFSRGEPVGDVAADGYEETKELAGAFNTMRRAVEEKETELGRSEYRFRSLMEQASDAILIADKEGRLLDANEEAMRLLGRDREEIASLTFADIHPPDIRDEQYRHFKTLWETGSVRVHESQVLRPDGVRSPVSIAANLIDIGGETVAQGIFRDMTEVRAAEAEADLFRHMVNQSGEIILLVDPGSGQILYANEGATRVLGYTEGGLVTERVTTIVVNAEGDAWWRQFVKRARDGEERPEETVLRRRAGSLFPAELSMRLSQVGGDEYALIMGRDIVDRLRHTKLQQVARSLEEANRELKEFNAVVSHDLQSPLTTISGFSARLLDRLEGKLEERDADYLQRIDGAARRMSELISDLLEYSWAGGVSTKAEELDMGKLLEGLCRDMAGVIEKTGGKVTIGPLPKVYGDATLLRQAFQNLIGNALKYRKEGRPPLVTVTHDEGCDQPNLVVLIVEDNGVGFAQDDAERIFKVFERLPTGGNYKGTGIGLATTRKIVERHGGSISASSIPDVGTKFFVALTAVPG